MEPNEVSKWNWWHRRGKKKTPPSVDNYSESVNRIIIRMPKSKLTAVTSFLFFFHKRVADVSDVNHYFSFIAHYNLPILF